MILYVPIANELGNPARMVHLSNWYTSSDVTGFKKSGSGPVWVYTVGFGLRAGLGLGSRVRVFCRVFTLSFITNWGSGLVPVYVEKSGLGFGL